jgi:hypothetical protein
MKPQSRIFLSIPLITVLAILSSCQFTPALSYVPIDLKDGQIHTILFSSPDDRFDERNYYQALLNLQNKYPDKLKSIKVYEKENNDLIEYFNVTTFPTLLVLDGENIKVKIEGNRDIDHIMNNLEPAYE